jgi:hypothetical protein
MNGASHADQRDFSIRFVLYTESNRVLLSIYNVLCTVELDIKCTEWLNNARLKGLVSGNEAVAVTSGSEKSPLVAENDRYEGVAQNRAEDVHANAESSNAAHTQKIGTQRIRTKKWSRKKQYGPEYVDSDKAGQTPTNLKEPASCATIGCFTWLSPPRAA